MRFLLFLISLVFAKEIYLQKDIDVEIPKEWKIKVFDEKKGDYIALVHYEYLPKAISNELYIIRGVGSLKTFIISHKPLKEIKTIANVNLPVRIFLDSLKLKVKRVSADLKAFQAGSVDAIVSDKFISIKNSYVYDLNLLGLKFNRYYLVATKGYVKKYPKRIKELSSFFENSGVNISPILTALYIHKKVLLSKEFENYFKNYITNALKVVVTPYWPPFNVLVDGKLQGIVIDMWKLIAKKARINYEFVIEPIWKEVLEGIKTKKYDIEPGTSETPDRKKYAIFSKPYMEFPFGIACREGVDVKKIEDIKSLAVGYNYTAHKMMKLHYPNMHFVPAKSVIHAFRLVEKGEADCVVDMMPIVVWVMNQYHIGSIKLKFKTPFTFKLQVMLRKDLKELRDKIDIAIDEISVFEKNKIIAKYLGEEYVPRTYLKVLLISFVVFVILVIFIWYKANEYRKKAQIDPLTGVYNRGALEVLFKEVAKKSGGSVIFFDIDHFKHINDTYGHEKGDFVLKKLAEIVKKNIREEDIFGRWGGEEFVIVLPNKPYEKALVVAEKIRKIVENSDFDGLKVTISIGVSEFHEGDDILEAINKADEAMYEAKRSGRNQVKGKR